MRTSIIIIICVTFSALLMTLATHHPVNAGPVVPKSDSSTQEDHGAGLPDLPDYSQPTDDDEDKDQKRKSSTQQPTTRPAPGPQYGAGGYGQPQMPLPPTYSPGAPASYGQPASAAQLPMSPTSYGTYNSPTGFGQPEMAPSAGPTSPGQMGPGGMGQGRMMTGPQGGFGLPPAPTAQSPMGFSPTNAAGIQQAYGPHSPSGVRQQTTPQRSVASHQQSTVPSGAKPFSGYTRKSPYSPYMSLFRERDAAEGINNYYSLVKPQLEQQQDNQRVGREIRNLQNTAQTQGLGLQQLYQQRQAKQRPGNMIPGMNTQQRAPATFMNTQQYYPGLR